MKDETTSMEVEGAKAASTLASASDATATGSAMSGLGADVHHGSGGAVQHGSAQGSVGASHAAAPHREATMPARSEAANEGNAVGAPTEDEDDIGSEPPPPKGPASSKGPPPGSSKGQKKHTNNLRKLRIERMMSKAELARRANLSVLTIDRIEKGFGCRMDSKRKILEALGLSLADRVRVFGEEE